MTNRVSACLTTITLATGFCLVIGNMFTEGGKLGPLAMPFIGTSVILSLRSYSNAMRRRELTAFEMGRQSVRSVR